MQVLIYPNLNKMNALKCTLEACELLQALGVQILIQDKYQQQFGHIDGVKFGTLDDLAAICDLIITVGGDGTILKCSHTASIYDKAILGINSGRLGFMASIERDEIIKLTSLVSGEYTIQERMMLEVSVISDGVEVSRRKALNDIVVSKGPNCKISDYKLSVGTNVVTSVRADGLIFSTPTGSTAYSLSAGGPIIDPDMECIEFTQICPHSLFARSMVFSANKTLRLTFGSIACSEIRVSVDGMDDSHYAKTDELLISKSKLKIKLIQLEDGNFYNSINNKLMKPLKD